MIKTIAGPFPRLEAQDTAKALDDRFSAYGINVQDSDGYIDDAASELNWFVEMDDSIKPKYICGLTWEEIQARQQGRLQILH